MSNSKDNDLHAKLDDEQFEVTQNAATERAFTGKYVDDMSGQIFIYSLVNGPPRRTRVLHVKKVSGGNDCCRKLS